jgi:hypothetical protein
MSEPVESEDATDTPQKALEQWLEEDDSLPNQGHDQDAIAPSDQAIMLNSNDLDTKPPPGTVLFPEAAVSTGNLRDFFISYSNDKEDFKWAMWIEQELKDAKYTTILRPQKLQPKSDFEAEIEKARAKAKRIISILSPAYLSIVNAQQTWVALFKQLASDEQNILVPIGVQNCGPKFRKFLNSIDSIDLVEHDEATARAMLIASIHGEGLTISSRVIFPGKTLHNSSQEEVPFPGKPNFSQHVLTPTAPNSSIPNLAAPQQKPTPIIHPLSEDIELFFSYAHEDIKYCKELEKYLSPLRRTHPPVKGWHYGEIVAGKEWDKEIKARLKKAHIILVIITHHFIYSNYCYNVELQHALARHYAGDARVIPIIARSCLWEDTPLHELRALPKAAKPISQWNKSEDAYMDILRGIQEVVKELTNLNLAPISGREPQERNLPKEKR